MSYYKTKLLKVKAMIILTIGFVTVLWVTYVYGYYHKNSFGIIVEALDTISDSTLSNNSHQTKCENIFENLNCPAILPKERHRKPDRVAPEIMGKLGKTLLIVHYNTPQYGSAIRNFDLYSKIFAKIVFCGPEDAETQFWPHYTDDSAFSLEKEFVIIHCLWSISEGNES